MTRLLSGLLLAGAIAALIWFGTPVVLLCTALLAAGICVFEYVRIAEAAGFNAPRALTLVCTLATVGVLPFPWLPLEIVLTLGLVLIAVGVMLSPRPVNATLGDVAAAMLAPLYIGLPLGLLLTLHSVAGRLSVVLLIATVIASDSAQFYVGRTLGRVPLAPRLSPKKTREGAIGGVVIGSLVFVGLGRVIFPSAAPLSLAGVGVLITLAGICGDLFESMLKRGANLKDSASLIPGHGGLLDRIDALLFAVLPFYCYYFYLRTL